jgi:adenosylcobinamide kinase/adenosylcobinamide-phosphate guanylyltransferase
MTTTLVLGGARSGKSRHAEMLAEESGHEVIYIATAHAGDGEMAERIAHHRASRPAHWKTVEEPLMLAAAIERHSKPGRVILVDCLTLWLSNLMFSAVPHGAGNFPETGAITLPPLFAEQRGELLDVLDEAPADIILVSNEVGLGIVPMGAVSRCFVDEQGRLNQALASACDRAVFISAGLPMMLKGRP